jgi:hypothetical protein
MPAAANFSTTASTSLSAASFVFVLLLVDWPGTSEAHKTIEAKIGRILFIFSLL